MKPLLHGGRWAPSWQNQGFFAEADEISVGNLWQNAKNVILITHVAGLRVATLVPFASALLRAARRQAQALALPAVLFLFAAYFGWQATQGSRGLHEYVQRQKEQVAALAELKAAKSDLAVWQRRVAALRSDHLDLDVLDERVRAMLNLSHPDDIIVPYGAGQKLF